MFSFFKKKKAAPEIWRHDDLEELSRAGASFVREMAKVSLRAQERFSIALSGGSTPGRLYRLLPQGTEHSALDWRRIHLFWGDERCAPPEHEHSNFRLANETFLSRIDIPEQNIHRMRGELGADEGAVAYQHELETFFQASPTAPPPAFDIVLLGMGGDGHTASLFPGVPALEETTRWAAPVFQPPASPAVDRITLTLPLINQARIVLILVAGGSKAEVLDRILHDQDAPERYPIARVAPKGRLIWLVDDAAMGA